MGVQVVRKASTPPFSEADVVCPVAILARQAAALMEPINRVADARWEEKIKSEDQTISEAERRHADMRLCGIERMQEALEERLDLIQKNASVLLAKSPEGAQYQLSQLFHIGQLFSCGEEHIGDKGKEYVVRMHGLALALRSWFQTNYHLPPNDAEKWEYAGIQDVHKTMAAALNFDGGEIPDDDAV